MKENRLWTKNFTIITLGTFISIVGCASMNLALSLVIFDQTSSTWLSGVYAAVSFIPSVFIPIFLAPVIDRYNPKRLIAGLDFLTGLLYLGFLYFIRRNGFQYEAYMIFGLFISSGDAVYDLAYQCLYPDLIPEGFKQKGYAVSAMLDPLATALVAPVIAVVYSYLGIEIVFLSEGLLLIMAAVFETGITYERPKKQQTGILFSERLSFFERFLAYREELLDGIRYLRKEKGIRSIYTYMAVSNAAARGRSLMTMAHFQSSSVLTTTMYSFLISAETVGRFVGGFVHYMVKIPEEKRYQITVRIYMLLELCGGWLLFAAYPVMVFLKFICGFLGVNSATIREAAVQNYLPAELRARVNGLFNAIIAVGMMFVQLLVGALGEILPYSYVTAGFAAMTILCIFLLIVKNKREIQMVYYRRI